MIIFAIDLRKEFPEEDQTPRDQEVALFWPLLKIGVHLGMITGSACNGVKLRSSLRVKDRKFTS